MPARIPWSQHEVALLFDAYLRAAKGADLQQTAAQLSVTLRGMAERAGVDIDETYRNVNGIKMQLANVQYLFTGGVKGLSGASGMIRQMYEQYQADPSKYQSILKEAILMTGTPSTSVQDAFFAYAQGKIGLPTRMLSDYLQKAADYCHLKQPLLGITDVQEVRRIQQKVAEGKLLRFRYGKDAQTIRNVTQLYYNFVKSYRETKAQPATQLGSTPSVTKEEPPQLTAEAVDAPPALEVGEVMQDADEPADLNEEISETDPVEEAVSDNAAVSSDELWVDFSVDNSYLFTKPNYYIYKGNRYDVKSWNRLYVEVCGLLFADYHDAFMGSMNGDILGYNALIFADEQNYRRMRTPKPFAPGYYLESNLDATSIVRKLCGLHRLFNVGDALQISYRTVVGYQPSQPKTHKEIGNGDQLSVDSNYNWHRDGLRLMDFSQEISYAFTQPEAYQYNGVTKRVSKWGKLYADLCGALFEDHHDAFMGIMNGDIPGYNALAFADEQHKTGMRVARQFAPGYYLESNIDATTIVRKIRGLHKLFGIGDKLRISYHATGNGGNDISAKEDHSDEWIIEQLKANGITYQDKRSRDGCLWIVGGHELDAFARDCKVHGYTLSFKADGCKTYPDKAVWWTKDQPESQEQIAIDVDEDSLDSFKQFLQEEEIADDGLQDTKPEPLPVPTVSAVTVSPEKAAHYNDVLSEAFEDGLRLLGMRLRKFRSLYTEKWGDELPADDEALIAELKQVGSFREDRIFAKQGAEQDSIVQQLWLETRELLDNGASCVYAESLLHRHEAEIATQLSVYHVDDLLTVMMEQVPEGYARKYDMLVKAWHLPDSDRDVLRMLSKSAVPLNYQEMQTALWYIPLERIKHALVTDPSMVNVDRETYFYAPNIPVTPEEMATIRRAMRQEIEQSGYMVAKRLVELIQQKCPSAAINLTDFKDWGLRNIFGYVLREEFTFSGTIISEKGRKIEMWDLYGSFCREREEMQLAELKAFSTDIGSPIYWDTVLREMVRVNATTFIRRDRITFNAEEADRAIADMCSGDMLPVQDIQLYLHFPPIEVPWNIYVLESYLHRGSKLFRIEQASVSQDKVYGIVVRNNTAISSYKDAVIQLLANSHDWQDEASAMEIVIARGCQATRLWSNFSEVAKAAALLREKLDEAKK